VFGAILMVAVAVAVVAILRVPVTNLIAFGTTAPVAGATAGVAAGIAGGAIAGTAGSIASQGFGLAAGIQDKFNWKGVALAGISGGIAGGLSQFGALAKAGEINGTLGKVGKFLGGTGVLGGAASSITGNLVSQGLGLAVGLQSKFDFAGVAVAGVVGGISAAAGEALASKSGLFGIHAGLGSNTNAALSGTASGLAGAAARSLIEGSDFGDNLMAALPDIIGATIGRAVARGVMAGSQRQGLAGLSRASTAPEYGASSLDGDDLFDLGLLKRVLGLDLFGEEEIVVVGQRDRMTAEGYDFLRRLQDSSIAGSLFDRGYRPGNVFLQGPTRPTLQTYIRRDFSRSTLRLHATAGPSAVSSSETGAGYDSMGQPLNGRSNYDAGRQLNNIISDANKVSLGTTLGRLGGWLTYRVPDAAQRNAEMFDPYRGMTPQGRMFAQEMDRLAGGTVSGISYGVANELGASAAVKDLVYGLGSSADGLLLSGAALRGATIQPFTGQNSLTVTGGRTTSVPNPYGKLGGPEHRATVSVIVADISARGLKARTEFSIATPNGDRGSRSIDVVAIDSAGRVVESYQVGRQTGAGNPVARETRAINDIRTARPDLNPVFVPYNK
ncbi:hypothetical protein, partial [Sphingomonas sp. Root241]|uniref:hypothetical protein n=1 Tax=Sphingomonas sp. Root241 TaxID=1736501 RepID=UPI0039DFAA57